MKKFLLLIASVAMLAASCDRTPKTVIVGQFGNHAPDSVRVTIKSAKIDTIVKVVPLKHKIPGFRFKTPYIQQAVVGKVECPFGNVTFIPDGSTIVINYSGVKPVVGVADPASVNVALQEFLDWTEAFRSDYKNLSASLRKDTTITDEDREAQLTAMDAEYVDYCKKAVTANQTNAIAGLALNDLHYELGAEEMASLMSGLSEDVLADETVAKIKSVVDTKLATAEGKMFADFTVDEDGTKVKLSDYVGKGKYMLVDFWASWCAPCKKEIPNIAAVYKKYHGADFDVLSIGVADSPANIKNTAKALGITWNQITNGTQTALDAYGIEGIPHIILFGPDGTIVKRGLRGDEIAAAVAECLKK